MENIGNQGYDGNLKGCAKVQHPTLLISSKTKKVLLHVSFILSSLFGSGRTEGVNKKTPVITYVCQ